MTNFRGKKYGQVEKGSVWSDEALQDRMHQRKTVATLNFQLKTCRTHLTFFYSVSRGIPKQSWTVNPTRKLTVVLTLKITALILSS